MAVPRPLALLTASLLVLPACVTAPERALLEGAAHPARLVVGTARADLPLEGDAVGHDAAEGVRPADAAPVLVVQTRLLALERPLARRLLGERATGLATLVAPRPAVEQALATLRAEGLGDDGELVRADLFLADGGVGTVSAVTQEAFVEAFELVVTEDAAIADPRVAVLTEGVHLSVTARAVEAPEGGTALELDLALADLERPIESVAVDLGGPLPLHIDAPRCRERRLTSAATLAPGDVLVLGGAALPLDDRRVCVALLSAGGLPAAAGTRTRSDMEPEQRLATAPRPAAGPR
jgi:hypothetical protein